MAVGLKQLARKPRRSIFGAFALLCVVALNLPLFSLRESAAHAYADVGALPVALATILGKGLINEHLAAKMLYPAAFAHNVFWAAACKIHILDGACHVPRADFSNLIESRQPLYNPSIISRGMELAFTEGSTLSVAESGCYLMVLGALIMLIKPAEIAKSTSKVALGGAALLAYSIMGNKLRIKWGLWVAVWAIFVASKFARRRPRTIAEIATDVLTKQQAQAAEARRRLGAVQSFSAVTAASDRERGEASKKAD